MSHNIIGRETKHPACGCHPSGPADRYERAIAEAEEAKRKFVEATTILGELATEANATANKDELLAAIDDLTDLQECTVSDIYAMFNEWACPFRLDAEGYIVISKDLTYVDEDGYIVLPSPAVDIERYIEVLNPINE